MIIQQVNRTDTERVWVSATNGDGQTLTAHYPAFKFGSNRNTASVSTNEVGRFANAINVNTAHGSFVGIVYNDIASGQVGLVQVFGYHESALVLRTHTNVTVVPGHPLVPSVLAASVGFSSVGAVGFFSPVVALDTVTAVMHSDAGTDAVNYVNHVYIRAM